MLNDNIIPDDMQAELVQLRDVHKAIQFRVGDVTARIVEYTRTSYIPKMTVYKSVGNFFGKSSRSIRVYAQVAVFFAPEIREAYAVLAFEHFRVACSMGDRWREVLDWSVAQVDTTGKPATIDALLNEFYAPAETDLEMECERGMLRQVGTHISGIRAVFEEKRDQLPAGGLERLWSSLHAVDKCAQELICMLETG